MGLLTFAGIIAAIAFAFGERAAIRCVQVVILTLVASFAYVMFRIVSGTL